MSEQTGSPLHVEIDPEVCVGAGQCVLSSEIVFDQDDTGTGVVLEPDPPAEERDAVREAARVCPSQAILLEEG